MEKSIQDFVENYNKCMDWNIELRQRINTDLFSDHEITTEILDNYLSEKKITPEKYDLQGAVMYMNAPDHYELHAYSYLTYHEMYFWTTFGMTKEEYIADRLRVVQRELSREIAYTDRQLADISIKKEKLEQFNNNINNL